VAATTESQAALIDELQTERNFLKERNAVLEPRNVFIENKAAEQTDALQRAMAQATELASTCEAQQRMIVVLKQQAARNESDANIEADRRDANVARLSADVAGLRSACAQKDDTERQLSAHIASLQENLETPSLRADKLDKLLVAAQSKHAHELDCAERSLRAAQALHTEQQNKFQLDAQQGTHALELKQVQLKQQVATSDATVSRLSAQLDRESKAHVDTQQALAVATAQLAAKQDDIQHLEATLITNKAAANALKQRAEQLDEALLQSRQAFEAAQVSAKELELAQQAVTISSLRSEAQDAAEAGRASQAVVANLRTSVQDHKRMFALQSAEKGELLAAFQHQCAVTEAKQLSLTELSAKLHQLELDLAALKDARDKDKSALRQCTEAVATGEAKLAACRSDLQSTLSKRDESLAQLNALHSTKCDALSSRDADVSELEHKLAAATAHAQTLQRSLNARELKFVELEALLERASQNAAALELQHRDANTLCEALQTHKQRLERDVLAMKSSSSEAHVAAQELQRNYEALQTAHAALKSTHSDAELTHTESQQHLDSALQTLKSTRHKHDAELSRKNEELQTSVADASLLRQQLEQLNIECSTLRESAHASQQESTLLQEKLAKQNNALSSLHTSSAELQELSNTTAQSIDVLRQHKAKLEQQLSAALQTIESLST
jgi:chromosome segregation ATPase